MLKTIEGFDTKHLPIINAYLERIGVEQLIDQALNAQMWVGCGMIVKAMIFDILCATRTPLYRLSQFFEVQDRELLFGKPLSSSAFNDDNVGSVLDRIYHYGTMKLFSDISVNVFSEFSLDASHVHHDTTSINVWGTYKVKQDNSAIDITYGHSKDKRPDLKQFMLSLLCVEKNIPIYAKAEDGNASDKKVNHQILTKISRYMQKHGVQEHAFIYVADSAVVTPDNLKLLGETLKFISRLPATYNACHQVIIEAVKANCWQEAGHLNDKASEHKGHSALYKIYEATVTIDEQTFRAVVIHSDLHDKRKQSAIERKAEREQKKLEKQWKKLARQKFCCREDAQNAADELNKGTFNSTQWNIEGTKTYAKGRPKKGCPKEVIRIDYIVRGTTTRNESAVKEAKRQAGCFVLISNLKKTEQCNATYLLKTYKEQFGVELNFGFIKDPVIANDLFLKEPRRVEALAFVLLLALLVCRLIERDLRAYVNQGNTTLPGWDDRRTKRPTVFMLSTFFARLRVLKAKTVRAFQGQLTKEQSEYLAALKLSEDIFIKPMMTT